MQKTIVAKEENVFGRPFRAEMDAGCVHFCDVLNSLPGIRTFDSCSGHGKLNYYICFEAEDEFALRSVVQFFDKVSPLKNRWCVKVESNDPPQSEDTYEQIFYVIFGPQNEKKACKDADFIASFIEAFVENGLDLPDPVIEEFLSKYPYYFKQD